MLHKIYISNKRYFELSIHQNVPKKYYDFHKNIKQHKCFMYNNKYNNKYNV